MSRLAYVMGPGAGVAVLLCAGWMVACPDATSCAAAVGGMGAATAAAVVIVPVLTAWAARAVWLLQAGRRATTALQLNATPAELALAMDRTGVGRVKCLATAEATAFCAGALKPKVYVSRGLIDALRSEELDAVLLHEAHHVSRLDPLRRAATRSLADTAFFVPLVRWWADRQVESSELAADRAVLGHLGPKALAGALWVAGQPPAGLASAGFAGAADLRAAQLLGETTPTPRPPASVLTASAMGLLMSVALTSCLLHVAAFLG
jgi:Zn-dependent protease with chaperone function